MITRRGLLAGGAAAAAACAFPLRADDLPPIVFVHGDSDQAAIWQTTFWRFESNGYPREKLFAISFTNPQARTDNGVEEANRSSTDDERKELAAFVDAALAKPARPKLRWSPTRAAATRRAITCATAGPTRRAAPCFAAASTTAYSRFRPC